MAEESQVVVAAFVGSNQYDFDNEDTLSARKRPVSGHLQAICLVNSGEGSNKMQDKKLRRH